MKLQRTCATIQCRFVALMSYDTMVEYWCMGGYSHHFCISSFLGWKVSLHCSTSFLMFFGSLENVYRLLARLGSRSASFPPVHTGQLFCWFLFPSRAGLASPHCFHVFPYVWNKSSILTAWGSYVFTRATFCVPFALVKISFWPQHLLHGQGVASIVAIDVLPCCILSGMKLLYSWFDALKGNENTGKRI